MNLAPKLNLSIILTVILTLKTSNTVLWLLYNLARCPHIQEKLYQEVENVVGKDGVITTKCTAKLRYLKACLKESMR